MSIYTYLYSLSHSTFIFYVSTTEGRANMEYDITTSLLSFILSQNQWLSSSKSIVAKAALWVVSIALTIFIIRPFTQCKSCGVGSNADAGTWTAIMTSSCLRWEVGTRFLTSNVMVIIKICSCGSLGVCSQSWRWHCPSRSYTYQPDHH